MIYYNLGFMFVAWPLAVSVIGYHCMGLILSISKNNQKTQINVGSQTFQQKLIPKI